MQENVPRFASEAERLTWCKAIGLGTALAMNAGCPGAQLRPEPGDCPADAIKAMKKHGLKDGDDVEFSFGWVEEEGLSPPLKSGRVEATIVASGVGRRTLLLPDGTRLFGELWTAGQPVSDFAYARFYRAQLPGGPEFPVCIIASDDGDVPVLARPEPGVIRVDEGVIGTVVYRWSY
jgi:serine/threonine-protein kinase